MAISKNLPWRREAFTYARNGKIPTAEWRRSIVGAANHVMEWQRRELFSSVGQLTAIPAAAGAGPRARWRFRAPTGYGARALLFTGLMAQTPTTGAGPAYTKVTAVPVGGGTTLEPKIYYGNIGSGTVDDSLDELGEFSVTVACAENTMYEFVTEDYENARIAQLTVYELGPFEAIPPTVGDLIVPNYAAVGAPILDGQRARLLEMLTQMWSRNSAVLFQYAAERDDSSAPELASATQTNILDETSTTVTSATPPCGEVDLTYKRTLGTATVKAEFWCYARTTSGSGGSVRLKNSAGTLATITGITTVGAWYSASCDLTAQVDKYDVHMATSTGTIRVLGAGLCMLF